MLEIVTLPVSLPVAGGLNCTPIVIFCDGDKVTGVPAPLKVKPVPVLLIPEIVTLALPVSVIVKFWVVALPVLTFPKLKLEALTEIVAVAATPLPFSATVLGEVGALLTIETLPLVVPGPCGAN